MKKRKNRFFRRVILCTLALSMAFAASGCGEVESNGKIAVIVRGQGAQYWQFCEQGAIEAGNELRYDVTYQAPKTEAEDNVQVELIRQAIKDNVDALVISPLDTSAVASALTEVQQAGIPIVMINNEADKSFDTKGRKICIATNTPAGGAIAARQAREMISGSGKIKVLSHTTDANVDNGRLSGFNEEIESDTEKYGQMEILEPSYCGADSEAAYTETIKAIDEYKDELKLIYATNENTSLGACKAVQERGLSDKLSVIGFDSSDNQIAYLNDNVLDGMIVQNPYNMGYLGVRYAHQVINNNEVPDTIDTGVTFVNRNNYDDDGVQLVLDPVKYAEKKNSGAGEQANNEEAE